MRTMGKLVRVEDIGMLPFGCICCGSFDPPDEIRPRVESLLVQSTQGDQQCTTSPPSSSPKLRLAR
jgi:hypothetical protein